jgi:hypothetical protein
MRRIFLSSMILLFLAGCISFLLQPVIQTAANSSSPIASATISPPPAQSLMDGVFVLNSERMPQAEKAYAAAAGPLYYHIYGAAEFHPNGSDITYSPSSAGLFALSLGSGGNSFKKQLDLPNGAQITRISAYVIDNDPVNNMTIEVTRNQPSLNMSQTYLIAFSTTNASTSLNVQTITTSGTPLLTIDNSKYAYFLRYQPSIIGSNHILVGVQVEFTVPAGFLPLILK